MNTGRILVLGSQTWTSENTIRIGLTAAAAAIPMYLRAILVRNSYANGAPKLAADVWAKWVKDFPGEFTDAQLIPPGGDFISGIDVCVTFLDEDDALGLHEARAVRAAGVRVADYGVATDEAEAAA